MRILTNTTSPYARIARIALGEKGFDIDGATELVNPWNDDRKLRDQNSAARVPAIVTDSGIALTESLLILLWLEKSKPEPSLTEGDLDRLFHQAGIAMGVIDAMANIVTNVMQVMEDFAEHRVGLRRRRTIVEGFRELEADTPAYESGTPNVAVITGITALDYAKLRFPSEDWVEPTPNLEALRAKVADRPAFRNTEPYVPS